MSGKYLALRWLRRILGLGLVALVIALWVHIVRVLVEFFSLDVFEKLFGVFVLPEMLFSPAVPYIPVAAILAVAYVYLLHLTEDKYWQGANDQDSPKT